MKQSQYETVACSMSWSMRHFCKTMKTAGGREGMGNEIAMQNEKRYF